MDPLKMYFLLKMGIVHGYVSLPDGTYFFGIEEKIRMFFSSLSCLFTNKYTIKILVSGRNKKKLFQLFLIRMHVFFLSIGIHVLYYPVLFFFGSMKLLPCQAASL